VHIRAAPEGTQGSLPDDFSLGTVFFTVLPNTFLARDPAQARPKAITKRTIRCSMRGVFNQLSHHISVLHADGSVLVPYYEHATI
jgi:hypothetical protein